MASKSLKKNSSRPTRASGKKTVSLAARAARTTPVHKPEPDHKRRSSLRAKTGKGLARPGGGAASVAALKPRMPVDEKHVAAVRSFELGLQQYQRQRLVFLQQSMEQH